jgi:hypothetical protein
MAGANARNTERFAETGTRKGADARHGPVMKKTISQAGATILGFSLQLPFFHVDLRHNAALDVWTNFHFLDGPNIAGWAGRKSSVMTLS